MINLLHKVKVKGKWKFGKGKCPITGIVRKRDDHVTSVMTSMRWPVPYTKTAFIRLLIQLMLVYMI